MNRHVEFYNRHGKKLREANYISPEYASAAIVKHMDAHPANIVKIDGRLCFTVQQADKVLTPQTSV